MKKPQHFIAMIPCCVALLTCIASSVWAQQSVEFVNTHPININTPRFPEDDGSVVPMVATPYPSAIRVSGFPVKETIAKITVTLHDLSHENPDDIDMLLVGPEGQSIVLFSDAGGGFFGGGGGLPEPEAIVNVTLDDDAAASLPDDTPLASGIFKPSNYELEDDDDPDIFPDEDENGLPTPHPDHSSATKLSVFAGTHPNGEWRLYVVDDEIDSAGTIAKGWSLTIRNGTQPSQPFHRGDANADGAVGLTDAVVTLTALFQGGPQPACADAADADDDGSVNLTDAVYTLDYLFRGGSAPPAPGPQVCGLDPTEDALPCDSFLPCRSSECFGGQLDCNGVCTEVGLDPSNCGACGVVCPPGMNCAGGSCQPAEPCEDCEF